MRVLVTGSSGQLGAEIVRQLARRGDDVVGLDLCAGERTTHVGSITDARRVADLTLGVHAIVHTASLHAAHLNSHSSKDFVETNVNGTINLLDAAAHGAAVLLISEDLDEIFTLADRIGVMFKQRLIELRPREDWSVEEIGLAMAGTRREHEHAA